MSEEEDRELLRICARNTLKGKAPNAKSTFGDPMWCMACATNDQARPGTMMCAAHTRSQASSND